MNISSCCRYLLRWNGAAGQGVLCKRWILPLRVAVVLSLIGHLLWWVMHSLVFYTVVLVAIHGTIAMRLLFDCRRSELYHRTIEEFERRAALLGEKPS